jgi:hypothetical protein
VRSWIRLQFAELGAATCTVYICHGSYWQIYYEYNTRQNILFHIDPDYTAPYCTTRSPSLYPPSSPSCPPLTILHANHNSPAQPWCPPLLISLPHPSTHPLFLSSCASVVPTSYYLSRQTSPSSSRNHPAHPMCPPLTYPTCPPLTC